MYLPGFLKGDFSADPNLSATHSVLIGDNINKVPRDLQEVGPTQTKFSSDEVLFPVVENYAPISAAGRSRRYKRLYDTFFVCSRNYSLFI